MVFGTSAGQALTATAAKPFVIGMGGNDTITGSAGDDLLVGDYFDKTFLNALLNGSNPIPPPYQALVGNDVLNGGNGNDELFDDLGNDVLNGGNGDDYFLIYVATPGADTFSGGAGMDVVEIGDLWNLGFTMVTVSRLVLNAAAQIEVFDAGGHALSGTAGNDTVDFSGTQSAQFGTGVGSYDLMLQGGNDLYRACVVGDSHVDGGAGNDTLVGGSGFDRFNGGTGADSLVGDAGNDTFYGGTGIDTLSGGLGNDLYVVDTAGDLVVEGANGGKDQVRTALAKYTLTAEVETLTFTGTSSFTGIGNASNNSVTGGLGHDSLNGLAGNDALYGVDGNDTLKGDVGNDTLYGGSGSNTLYGGDGNDSLTSSYGFYGTDGAQSLDGGAGNDTISGADAADTISGGSGDDSLFGWGGADLIQGGSGNDTLNASNGGDTVYGGAGNDSILADGTGEVLYGDAGDDVFDGNGLGSSTMDGGAGNDTFVVYSGQTRIVELAGGGIDTVLTGMAAYTLPDQVENLTAETTTQFTGVGNGMDNVITGGWGSASLAGMAGNDTLQGGDGGLDTLDGGAGDDLLIGGRGNDLFLVGQTGDQVREDAGGGYDTVKAALDAYTLGDNVEALYADGTQDFAGTGNALSNVIIGNSGDDTLNGGLGSDYLEGQAGKDTFVFSTALGASNIDTIGDFASGKDRIALQSSAGGVFAGLALGTLAPDAFKDLSQSPVLDADDRILYDPASGRVYFDPDGSGAAARVQFLQVTAGTVLAASDFIVL